MPQAIVASKDLREYLAVIARRRFIFAFAILLAALVALIATFLTPPIYRSSATLLIERQNPDILTFQDLAKVDSSWAAYNDFYQTQYKILGSKAVARIAVERLGLTEHPVFNASNRRPSLYAKLSGLIPRRGVREGPVDPVDRAAARVWAGLKISPVRKSQLVLVDFTAADPDLAAEVANAIADAYVQFHIESQYSTTDQAREFLGDQIASFKREIATSELQLQEYGEARRIVSIDDATNITIRAMQDIAQRRTVAQTRVAETKARFDALQQAPFEGFTEVRESALIARLREEYAAYEAEYAELAGTFKEDWPDVQKCRAKLDQARERLQMETSRIAAQVLASAESEYRRASAELENLVGLLEGSEDNAQSLKRESVEFANLQSEVEKKREALETMLRRQTELSLSMRLKDLDSTSTNIRIIERARPATIPFSPRLSLNLLAGLVIGLGLGVVGAVLLEHLDNSISSPEELSALAGLPVLAVVPSHGAPSSSLARVRRRPALASSVPPDQIALRDPRAAASEAYRDLRTSILLSSAGKPPQRIVVTSAMPDEGKTVTALNLAVVLAQLGRRVLLVDTDLRRPRLHKALGVENLVGVSTILSGLESDPRPMVVNGGIEGFDLLPSGPIPPNPSELINSSAFSKMTDAILALGYDHVLFDSPPVLSAADSVVLAHAVDFGLLVVRAGKTSRHAVRVASERLRQTNVCPFGLVLNDHAANGAGSPYDRSHYYGSDSTTRPAESSETQEIAATRRHA